MSTEHSILADRLREAIAEAGGEGSNPPEHIRSLAAVLDSSSKTAPIETQSSPLPDDLRAQPTPHPKKFRVVRRQLRFRWESSIFGLIDVQTDFPVGEPRKNAYGSRTTWVPIQSGSHEPPDLSIHFVVHAPNYISVLRALDGEVSDVTNKPIPFLIIPVNWRDLKDDLGRKAQTRQKGRDNVDFVFLNKKNGMFTQLQVSIVTRNKRFWLCMQEVAGAQAVRTTQAQAEKLGLCTHPVKGKNGVTYSMLTVPLDEVNAFPGSDWLKTFSGMGPKVLDFANETGAFVPLSRCVVADWEPVPLEINEEIRGKGWRTAVVTFFNLVVGFGAALCEDGKMCAVHFSNIQILDENGQEVDKYGKFPVLEASMGIALKWKDDPVTGRRMVTAIRPCPEIFKP